MESARQGAKTHKNKSNTRYEKIVYQDSLDTPNMQDSTANSNQQRLKSRRR